MKDSPYYPQAALMLRAIPAVAEESCFALKGGTAINLFVRDLPRLSVDIDLTYLPIEPRGESLSNIESALERIAARLERTLGINVDRVRNAALNRVTKLRVLSPGGVIKIEPNLVIRGTAFPSLERTLAPQAEALFELSATIQTVSLPDLYGGKLCAALDRQHCRDLFDILMLLENEGITDDIRKAFLVYLVSHDRPMHELLDGNDRDIEANFTQEFEGMARRPVTADELVAARARMRAELLSGLTTDEREFLLSMKRGEPKWALLGVNGAESLPAAQWKLQNIRKMAPGKRDEQLHRLATVLELE